MLDHIISWASLLFSGIALILAIRVNRRQSVLIDKEIADHEREAEERVKASLTIALTNEDSFAGAHTFHYILVTNEGPAEARDIRLAFPAGRSPIPENEAAAKLPIPVLQLRGSVKLMAAISMDCRPPFAAVLSWRDGTGERSLEATLA